MHPIIALWTYPRTISTAFERIMLERGDFEVFHEPFSYLYYVHENRGSIPQEYIDPTHPTSYAAIKQMLLQAAEKSGEVPADRNRFYGRKDGCRR